MGKRWAIILTLILLSNSIVRWYFTDNYNLKRIAQNFRNNLAAAQELSDLDSLNLITKFTFSQDAVVQKTVVTPSKQKKSLYVWVTAYTNDPAETKEYAIGITAMGTRTRDGVAAANFLPFGTKFKLPEIYGDKIFTVEDRMNERYNNQRIVDIWMPSKKDAYQFGKQLLLMELL
jgi:3D (Asp-Asp-Asp) domain-containing protein